MRYKTGSHVDSRGTAFNAGITKKNANKSGTFTWGPFFETGHGNYDSYLDNGTHGSGSTSYTGGGIFARQEFASGCYVEGSLRTGKTKADYSSSDLGTGYSTDAPYFGAHLGVGRVLPMDGGSLDIYGRYLYSRTGSDSAHLATGETYDFDAVDSQTATASCSARATRARWTSSANGTPAPHCSTNSAAKREPIIRATASRARRAPARPSC